MLYFPAGFLYWMEFKCNPIVLHRQKTNDLNTTCSQTIFDTTIAYNHSSETATANLYYPSRMQLYQDYIYVAYRGTSNGYGGSGLLRVNKYTGADEVVGNINVTGGTCTGLYIHGMY